MAGLYAAFRGIKSVMSDAIGANEEFGNSVKQIKRQSSGCVYAYSKRYHAGA